MINILIGFIVLISTPSHDFHVSVCDIEFSKSSNSIQISQRIFLDDIEVALNNKYDANLRLDDESTKTYRDSLIHVYLFEKINLRVDGLEKKRVFIGSEIEDDALWCYIEYESVGKFQVLEIQSTVLLDTFEDQANIVHFTYGDFEKSIKLDKLKKEGSFKIIE
jgi:hypothetical protein